MINKPQKIQKFNEKQSQPGLMPLSGSTCPQLQHLSEQSAYINLLKLTCNESLCLRWVRQSNIAQIIVTHTSVSEIARKNLKYQNILVDW